MRTVMSHETALEIANALFDAAQLSRTTQQAAFVNKIVNCYIAEDECDGRTHIKVLPPPIPLFDKAIDDENESSAA